MIGQNRLLRELLTRIPPKRRALHTLGGFPAPSAPIHTEHMECRGLGTLRFAFAVPLPHCSLSAHSGKIISAHSTDFSGIYDMNTPKTLVAGALALAFAVAGCSHLPSNTSTTPATGVKEMAEAPLTIQTYNPGEEAIFAVSSTLVQGRKEAILIDAQFSAEDARKLAEQIKASGKKLVAIYVSHSDPDYYFGLDTLKREFPEARIVATPQTVAAIQQNKDIKLKVWGPQLGENAPKDIIIPEALDGDRLKLEGQTLQVVGLDGPTPDRTFVWIPSIRVVAGEGSLELSAKVAKGEMQWP